MKYEFLKNKDINTLSYTDIGYYFMLNKKDPVYWKDVVLTMLKVKHPEQNGFSASLQSEVYTAMNLDGRFVYQRDGMWTLRVFLPSETKQKRHVKRENKNDKK